ncbi:MAG TPA: apolipoprotein N-acyltransferase [Isosphaeraceae bacterium]|nr:apolipoprotein N-acyltransferase [Isosphaeraceae bacterium]
MTSLAAPELDVHATETTERLARWSRHQLAAGIASGLLLWTSFPPVEWNWLVWLALTPLFWMAALPRATFKTYVSAWLGGLTFWVLAARWLRLTDPTAWPGWLALAVLFSLWWPGFLLLTRLAVHRLRVPLMLAAPIIWVGLEYVRAYFLSGFPWYYLAHSQFRSLYVIQIADFAGSLGVSLLVAITNAWLVDLVTLPLLRTVKGSSPRLNRRQYVRLCLMIAIWGSTLCYGAFRISTAAFHDGPKVALLQSNIEQSHKMKGDPNAIAREFQRLVLTALDRADRPDLIVWPETSYPFGFISVDRRVDKAALERQVRSIAPALLLADWIDKQQAIANNLHSWTDQAGVAMLVGSLFYDHQPGGLERYNSCILFEPNLRSTQFYHKMHLVPFGEYVPFVETLPWLVALTPYRGEKIPSLSFGRDASMLTLGRYRLAVSVCFEDTIPQVIGQFFDPARGVQPDVLINASNDGWFRGSEELDMHRAIGVFRAVEHRVPLVRAVNTGLSALIDGNGEIRAALPKDKSDVLSVTVPLDGRVTLYSRWGDWLGLSCLATLIGFIPLALFKQIRARLTPS